MKKIYFLLIGICFISIVDAQIIDIPDTNFKTKLVSANLSNGIALDENNNYLKIDTNNDGEIQVNEALIIKQLYISYSDLVDLKGIEYFKNLTFLYCTNNPNLKGLDVSTLLNLESIICSDNKLTSLKVSILNNIKNLACLNNELETIDFNALKNLEFFNCSGNKFSNLNLVLWSNLKRLYFTKNQLTSINLKGLKNIEELECNYNLLKDLDLRELKNLKSLNCFYNNLNSLNVNGLDKLETLRCEYNSLASLDLRGLKSLDFFSANDNKLTSLDITECTNIYTVGLDNNMLTSLFLKNGKVECIYVLNNPNLQYICADEQQISNVQQKINEYGYSNCHINSYCSFIPGGSFYTIIGNNKLDILGDGCDTTDKNYPNLNFSIFNGTTKGNIIPDNLGFYTIPVQEGTYTITPMLENPNYFNVSPSSVNITFPTQTSPFAQNFCISPKGVHNDLEVTILPTIPARPGFDVTYKIIYKNKGTIAQSGSVTLSFNDTVLDFVSASPNINSQIADKLVWDYTNLQPFETREITVILNVNSPMETPAVNIGDRLSFNALINPVTGDEKPVDNSSALRQSVVGSFDPNDKTCLEGDVITPSLIGEYVNYLIRFENTGTYPAENIVVKDLIDLTKFDISTLMPTKASHEFVTKISDGNKVEFIFEKINLPFDDAANDGYIAFKIKTLPTLVVGDSFANEANIYFDYNFPILTNKAISTFKTLGTQDFEFADYFNVYPNPANDILNIGTKKTIELQSMAVYDILGQLVIAVPNAQTVSKIDVSKLTTGNYFLKMNTDKGTSSVKFIKN
jgi:hypothetical protein